MSAQNWATEYDGSLVVRGVVVISPSKEFTREDIATAVRAVNLQAGLVAALRLLLGNAEDKARYIAALENREKFDDNGKAIADYSPEMETARAIIKQAAQPLCPKCGCDDYSLTIHAGAPFGDCEWRECADCGHKSEPS